MSGCLALVIKKRRKLYQKDLSYGLNFPQSALMIGEQICSALILFHILLLNDYLFMWLQGTLLVSGHVHSVYGA